MKWNKTLAFYSLPVGWRRTDRRPDRNRTILLILCCASQFQRCLQWPHTKEFLFFFFSVQLSLCCGVRQSTYVSRQLSRVSDSSRPRHVAEGRTADEINQSVTDATFNTRAFCGRRACVIKGCDWSLNIEPRASTRTCSLLFCCGLWFSVFSIHRRGIDVSVEKANTLFAVTKIKKLTLHNMCCMKMQNTSALMDI